MARRLQRRRAMCTSSFSSSCLVAFDDPVRRAWARYGLGAAGLDAHIVHDRGALFEALAHEPPLLVVGATFDRAPVSALLASIRTVGCEVVTLVVGAGRAAPRLWWRFASIATLDGELDSRALAQAVRELEGRASRAYGTVTSAYSNSV